MIITVGVPETNYDAIYTTGGKLETTQGLITPGEGCLQLIIKPNYSRGGMPAPNYKAGCWKKLNILIIPLEE